MKGSMSTVELPSRGTQKDDQEEHSQAGDEVNHMTDDDEAPEREPSRRRSKRARTVTSKSKAPRKKYVRGKQGALQGIMKMPIEVFTEIAYHITPGDLITLIRTNKFFRTMLLRQSASLIWQRAQTNVPGLPPCPTGMSEPQYAALMFSKFCTLCGAGTLVTPDPWLRVRLCALCRDTKLQDTDRGYEPGYSYVATSRCIKPIKSSRRRNTAAFCIRGELEQVCRLREDFQRKGDQKGLREWERERVKKLTIQKEEGGQLLKYIGSVTVSRANELMDLKADRREQIHERLEALGWDEKYFDFVGGELRQWTSLVDVPKPLTERIWANLLPKLTPLLEENRSRIDDKEKQLRRHERLEKVQRLMWQFKRDTHPYQAIVDALGLTTPAVTASHDPREVLSIPFPTSNTTLTWDFIMDIYEEENSLERVEQLFDERRGQLNDRVLKWRGEVETQLVEQYVACCDRSEQVDKTDPIITVQGSTETTKHISPGARFLLRADTVFVRQHHLEGLSAGDREYGPGACAIHFPDMISTFMDDPPYYYSGDQTDLARMENLVRHAGMEKITKILLRDMGTPDVTHIELSSKKDAFACGRCYRIQPMSWDELVDHYHFQARQWVGGKYKYNDYSTRHPIIVRNMHDLISEPKTKPLVHMVSDDERKASNDYDRRKEGTVWCLICSGMIVWNQQGARDSVELMREHMHEWHDITSVLVEGLHYTQDYGTSWRQSSRRDQWQKDWDAYHDTQQSGDMVEPEPQAGPSVTESASKNP